MTAYPCYFYGGPAAGQTHMIENPPTRYRVPSYTRPRITESLPAPLDITYEIEEYELGPGSNGATFTYTWINPAAPLRKRIKDMERSIDEKNTQLRELRYDVADYRADAERWRKLKATVQDLGLTR